jgi:hypothetical protein
MQDKAVPSVRSSTLARLFDPCRAAEPTSFHVALETMDARRSRDLPDEVRILGFVLFDTGDYEPVVALIPLELFWRMQGMDILAHTRTANRERKARPRRLPMTGSVWQVDAIVEGSFRPAVPASGERPTAPPRLRVRAVHALDRVAIVPRGPRFVETIDTATMLPKFAADGA